MSEWEWVGKHCKTLIWSCLQLRILRKTLFFVSCEDTARNNVAMFLELVFMYDFQCKISSWSAVCVFWIVIQEFRNTLLYILYNCNLIYPIFHFPFFLFLNLYDYNLFKCICLIQVFCMYAILSQICFRKLWHCILSWKNSAHIKVDKVATQSQSTLWHCHKMYYPFFYIGPYHITNAYKHHIWSY